MKLIDVRDVDEWNSAHRPDAINIPLRDIMHGKGLDMIPRDEEIHVMCASGARSDVAVEILKSLGYVKVKNIGGLENL